MARTKTVLGEGSRLADHLAVAYLALNCPLGRVREVLDELGLQSQRRRALPAEVAFFYTLALCLYRTVAYEEVWRVEMALDELKVHLNENMSLRSKTPDLVRQEFYALLFVYGTIRKLMTDAAATSNQAAEELSFTAAFRIVRRRLPGSVVFPPSRVHDLAVEPAE